MFADRPQDFAPYARVGIIREATDADRMEATVFDGPIWMQVIRARGFFEEAIQRSYTARRDGLLGHRMVYNWSESAFAEPSTQLPTTATRHCCSSRSTTPTTTRWWPVPSTRSSHTFAISGMRPPERLRRKLPRTHRKSPKTSVVLRRTLRRTLHYLRSNPKASAKEMANLFGLSQRAIEHQLRASGRRGVYNEMGRPKAANRL